VKYDLEKEELARDANGLLIEVGPDEPGELIGFIDPTEVSRQFSGYTDKKATEIKIARDVRQKGDTFFRTGDLLKYDTEGFVYFVDRLGDTFRWKGENISTGEVEQILNTFTGILEISIYGVPIQGYEGKAGMAAITTTSSFDLDKFYKYISENLSNQAAILFIRCQSAIEVTETFKHRKVTLKKRGD